MPGYRKLGRPTAHRKAMLRNLVTDISSERAEFLLPTAELRKPEEKQKSSSLWQSAAISTQGDRCLPTYTTSPL